MALLDGVLVDLGGRKFTVPPLNLKALKSLAPKIENLKVMKEIPTPEQIDDIVDILHAAFARNYPEITKEDLLDLVDLGNLLRIFPAVLTNSGMEQRPTGELLPMSLTGKNSSDSSAPV